MQNQIRRGFGFIPKWNSSYNLRHLFNIIYSSSGSQLTILSLDAEKAFDQIEWPYLFAVLKKFDFGDESWIKLLYSSPCARILTNQTISSRFELHRGTRQGCSLSPLLLTLVIEPLAEVIRTHTGIKGWG